MIVLLYIDLRLRQTYHSKDGGSAYSIGMGKLGWQYGTGLKSHGTATNWCTRKEWPVNCMTVISAQWRSNMPFQRRQKWHIPMASYGEILSGRLNYYITRWKQEVNQFGDRSVLETRCGRESQHPAESWASGWAAKENRKETRLWPMEWGSICCSSVWSPTPSHTQHFQIKWEVYFSKRTVSLIIIVCR